MGIVYNGTMEDVTIRAQGNYFTFKPEAKKKMGEHLCQFISQERAEDGLVVLPAVFEDPENDGALNKEFAASPEGLKLLAEAKASKLGPRLGQE
jgi:hypothetical protein